MQKKSAWIVLGATVLTIVASLVLVFAVGPLVSAADRVLELNDEKYFTVDSDGTLIGFSKEGQNFIQGADEIHITIPSRVNGIPVTSIGEGAFSTEDSVFKLTSVKFNEGLISIGPGAFKYVASLTSVEFPETLTSTGYDAFSFTGLTEINIPASVKTIDLASFSYCGSLKKVTFAENSQLEEIGDMAFIFTALTSVKLPEGLKTIGEMAFAMVGFDPSLLGEEGAAYSMSQLTTVYIPASVETIDEYAFAVMVPEQNGDEIDDSFAKSTSITQIIIADEAFDRLSQQPGLAEYKDTEILVKASEAKTDEPENPGDEDDNKEPTQPDDKNDEDDNDNGAMIGTIAGVTTGVAGAGVVATVIGVVVSKKRKAA